MKKFRFLILFTGFLLYSVTGVVAKSGSEASLYSLSSLIRFASVIILLGIYSALWQVSLKYIPLSVAFFCKGSVLIFSLVWAISVFAEKLTITNLVGAALIILGIFVMAYRKQVT